MAVMKLLSSGARVAYWPLGSSMLPSADALRAAAGMPEGFLQQ